MKRPLIGIATTATSLLVLAACSSTSNTTSPGSMSTTPMTTTSSTAAAPEGSATSATGAHNQADVTFATDMIAHHLHAVQMADMALTQVTNSDVKALAQAIKAAQGPEITQMSGWLTGWKRPVPSASSSAMGGTGGKAATGTGMMSDADMTTLGNASGATFDRMWVTMMIQHQVGDQPTRADRGLACRRVARDRLGAPVNASGHTAGLRRQQACSGHRSCSTAARSD